MKDQPAGVNQVKCLPAIAGLGENLETTRWYRDFAAEVRCRVCGASVTCSVRPTGEMSSVDRNFWLWHFRAVHVNLLPPEAREEL